MVAADGQRALLNFRDAGGMRENPFDLARRRHPDIAGFRMQRSAVVAGFRSLTICQERLADVTEGDFLVVAERLNRRVLAGAVTRPRTQQRSQRSDARMEVGHVSQGTASPAVADWQSIAGPEPYREADGACNVMPELRHRAA